VGREVAPTGAAWAESLSAATGRGGRVSNSTCGFAGWRVTVRVVGYFAETRSRTVEPPGTFAASAPEEPTLVAEPVQTLRTA
jgi:hypothetical protein